MNACLVSFRRVVREKAVESMLDPDPTTENEERQLNELKLNERDDIGLRIHAPRTQQ